jgi:excisionase family DNA binding protein
MTDEVLTIKEVAALLQLHPKTIGRLIKRGELPAQRIGRQWRMRRVDVFAVIKNGKPKQSV